jgi:carbamoyl-phosphate synthase small subunit
MVFLVLSDGTFFSGESFGAEREAFGEVVFNTSMTGYPEALTDPSYNGQILCLTYPLIGNYGVCRDWFESGKMHVRGFVVREACDKPSHMRGKQTISDFLKEQGVPGIAGIDTRSLVRKLRQFGVMNGAIVRGDREKAVEKAKSLAFGDLVAEVTSKEPREFNVKGDRTVVLIDCGAKRNIIHSLNAGKINVITVPASTPAPKILGYEPDGLLISNGPGDPKNVPYVVRTVKELYGQLPTMGICLGTQILALAAGGDTYKLKFGHRGANQPVKDLLAGRVAITSQNHGYAVDAASLEGTGFEVSHLNINDRTVEGIRHEKLPVFAVQYHPEACPGPHDSGYLFDVFRKMMK